MGNSFQRRAAFSSQEAAIGELRSGIPVALLKTARATATATFHWAREGLLYLEFALPFFFFFFCHTGDLLSFDLFMSRRN